MIYAAIYQCLCTFAREEHSPSTLYTGKSMKNILLGIKILCIIALTFSGYKMYEAYAAQKLWNILPLIFLSAFWILIVSFRLKKYNLRLLGLSALSGLLLTLGFPVSPLTPLMFIAFVPLFIIQKEIIQANNTPNTPRKYNVMGYAYNAFVIWNIGTTWWVANAGLIAGMIANFLNAFFMALTFWVAHKSALQLRGVLKIEPTLMFIIFWFAFEYLHLNWEISWTWLTLGNAFAQYPSWIQWYEYTGVFGGGLWILLVNVLIFSILNNKNKILYQIWKPIAAILLPLSISFILLKRIPDAADKTYNIVVVQPNYEPHYEKFDIPEDIQINKYLKLSAQAVDSTTDYLVFPETSFDFHNYDHWRNNPIVQRLQDFANQYPRLHIVTGVDALKIYAQSVNKRPENLPSTVREFSNRDGSFTYFEVYNASTQLYSGDSLTRLPLYKKSKLVPGPEILPYKFLFAWLKPLFNQFGGTVGGLGTQSERSVFTNKDGQFKVGTAICYESIFGDFCRGYVQKGANTLFVVTNDGWWDDTPGYKQHQKFASLRAIELRRPIIRSANTGSSCFVDIYGNISQATEYSKDAVIKGSISVYNKSTLYLKWGDIIGLVASVLSIIVLISVIFKKISSLFRTSR